MPQQALAQASSVRARSKLVEGMTTCAFAPAAEGELPSWLAMPSTELANALLAASASLRRSVLRSDRGVEDFLEAFLDRVEVLITSSVVLTVLRVN